MNPDPPTQDAASPTPPPVETEGQAHRGNGKVARLPKDKRNQVGQMLLDGFTYRQIIQSLGDLGQDLTEDHIRKWKSHGAYDRWLAHQDTMGALQATRDEALEMAQHQAAAPIQDAARAVASGQLYELLRLTDPRPLASALADKPEVYLRLVSTISRLSEADALCAQRRLQHTLAQMELEAQTNPSAKKTFTTQELTEILRKIKIL